MEKFDIEKVAGIKEDDGTVMCRDCMDEDEWDNLKEKSIISLSASEKGQRLYYCDYCDRRL